MDSLGVAEFFKQRPILLLLIITPGIPEYLSGSSALNAIIVNPVWFAFALFANLGLYGPGVLLIREAKVRWHKSWATVLLLGAAYGILEEGIALSTLFNPTAGPVGQLGFYGHFLGVSWIWTAGILTVHVVFSISLPILLLGLALPETRGASLLKSDRSVTTVFVILVVDVSILFLFIRYAEHFFMSVPMFAGALASIGVLVYLAWRAPADALTPKNSFPTKSPFFTGIIGALFYPSILLVEFLGMGGKLPAAVDFVILLVDQALYLVLVLQITGRSGNERNITALTAGLILPIVLLGALSEIRLPLNLIADAIAVYLLWRLWRKYPPTLERKTQEDHLLQ